MTPQVKHSARETRRLQTRQRILGAAIAEFKRSGMAGADVGAIVAAAGVAHGTFYFHFPTKEHVLLELESREERRVAAAFAAASRSARAAPKYVNKEALEWITYGKFFGTSPLGAV